MRRESAEEIRVVIASADEALPVVARAWTVRKSGTATARLAVRAAWESDVDCSGVRKKRIGRPEVGTRRSLRRRETVDVAGRRCSAVGSRMTSSGNTKKRVECFFAFRPRRLKCAAAAWPDDWFDAFAKHTCCTGEKLE